MFVFPITWKFHPVCCMGIFFVSYHVGQCYSILVYIGDEWLETAFAFRKFMGLGCLGSRGLELNSVL